MKKNLRIIFIYFKSLLIRNIFLILIIQSTFFIYTFMNIGYDKKNIFITIQISFMGFNSINNFLFSWLYLNLPILIILYNFLTQQYSKIRCYIMLKMERINMWYISLMVLVIIYIIIYYIIGIAVITFFIFLSPMGGELTTQITPSINLASQVIYIVAQNYFIIIISFSIWIYIKNYDIGFVCILILHVFFVLLSNNVTANGIQYMPLSYGIYFLKQTDIGNLELILKALVEILISSFILLIIVRVKHDDNVLKKV
ncbi:MAG: hypothetical protein ACK5JH_13765 [Anaerocolumna sp.]